MPHKRLLFISIMTVGLLTAGAALAVPGVPGPGFGVKAGLNFASLDKLESIDTSDELESEARRAFIGGAYVNIPMGAFKLQVEGLYSIKGSKGYVTSGLGTNRMSSWEVRTDYLEIPVLLRLDLPTPVLTPYVFGGVSYGILLKAEQRDGRTPDGWFDIKDDLKSSDWSMTVGAGAELFGLLVEGRYTRGLTDSVNDTGVNSVVSEASNEIYSVMVGLALF